jgi:hypothetical protein
MVKKKLTRHQGEVPERILSDTAFKALKAKLIASGRMTVRRFEPIIVTRPVSSSTQACLLYHVIVQLGEKPTVENLKSWRSLRKTSRELGRDLLPRWSETKRAMAKRDEFLRTAKWGGEPKNVTQNEMSLLES